MMVQKRLYIKCLIALVVLFIAAEGLALGVERKPKIVVFPFKSNCSLNQLSLGIEDVMRSELIRSGYFTVVNAEVTYEYVKDAVLYDVIKIDNADIAAYTSKSKMVDLFARIDQKVIVRIAEDLHADFTVKGTLNQFGEKFRADIEVAKIKTAETISSLVGECESKEKIIELAEKLCQQIVTVCRDVNVVKAVEAIQGGYQQRNLTYDEAANKLKNLSSEIPGVFIIHCALFVHYLGHPEKREDLIAEGEEIIKLFNAENKEDREYLSLSGIDPFYELANVYIVTENLDSAIDTYNRAIKIYPINHAKYYKQLGVLYKLEDKYEAAINAFEQALKIYPADIDARLSLVSLYEANGDMSLAIEQCQSCLKYAKNTSESAKVKETLARLQSKGNK
ncbi:MAG: tetratricopeptide repeat protein [Planctomycetota bacterium]